MCNINYIVSCEIYLYPYIIIYNVPYSFKFYNKDYCKIVIPLNEHIQLLFE